MQRSTPPAPWGRRQLLGLVLLIEAALLAVALAWAAARDIAWWSHWRLDAEAWGWIAAASAGMAACNLGAYHLALRLRVGAVLRFDRLLTSIFADTRLPDLLLISLAAGLAEEVAFRGVVQAEIGVVGAATLFGLMHHAGGEWWLYTLWAFLAGLFFGYLYQQTGNLLVPVAVHAAYDFLALIYIRYGRAQVTPP